MSKSLKKNFIFNILLTVSNTLIPVLTFPYVSRVLNPQGLGMANYANSVVSYLVFLACFGVNTYGLKEGAKYRNSAEKMNKFFQEMICINIVTTGLAILLLVIIGLIPINKSYTLLLVIYGLQIFSSTFSMSWYVAAIEEFEYVTIRSMIIQTLCMLLTFVLIKDASDYYAYAIISSLSSFFTMIINITFVRKKMGKLVHDKLEIKRHIKPMAQVFGGSLSNIIYSNSDLTMLGIMVGDYHVGVYAVSVKIVRLMITLVSSLSTVILPRNSFYKNNNMINEYYSLLKRGLDFLLMIALPSAAGISILSDEVILLFAGNQYLDAVINLRILAFNILISSFSAYILHQIVLTNNMERVFFSSTLIACIINIILNVFLIPLYYENAAAISTLISEALAGLSCIFFTKKHIDYKYLLSNIRDYLVATIVMCSLLVLVKTVIIEHCSAIIIILIVVPLGVVVYCVTLRVLKNYLFISLIGQIKQIWRKKIWHH